MRSGIPPVSKDVPEPREAVDDRREHQRGTVPVLDIGAVDDGVDEGAAGIGEDMALATLDLLARIIVPNPAALCGFNALTVDHPADGLASRPSAVRIATCR